MVNYEDDGEKQDKVFLVVEIGSLHVQKDPSQKTKAEIVKQLVAYIILLGEKSAR